MKEPKKASVYTKVLSGAEKATGKFYCFNCKTSKPIEEKRKIGPRVACQSCVDKKQPPRKMQTTKP